MQLCRLLLAWLSPKKDNSPPLVEDKENAIYGPYDLKEVEIVEKKIPVKGLYSTLLLPVLCQLNRGKLDVEQSSLSLSISNAIDKYDIKDPHHIAYIYATAWHECKMRSVREKRARKGTNLRKLQDRYWHTGYYGRGPVQLTWRPNYERMSRYLKGIDLVTKPNKALDHDIGATILVLGMKYGLFTGKRLSDYTYEDTFDPVEARRIVNGLDKANLITKYYDKMLFRLIN